MNYYLLKHLKTNDHLMYYSKLNPKIKSIHHLITKYYKNVIKLIMKS
jgi:hypothetical protein